MGVELGFVGLEDLLFLAHDEVDEGLEFVGHGVDGGLGGGPVAELLEEVLPVGVVGGLQGGGGRGGGGAEEGRGFGGFAGEEEFVFEGLGGEEIVRGVGWGVELGFYVLPGEECWGVSGEVGFWGFLEGLGEDFGGGLFGVLVVEIGDGGGHCGGWFAGWDSGLLREGLFRVGTETSLVVFDSGVGGIVAEIFHDGFLAVLVGGVLELLVLRGLLGLLRLGLILILITKLSISPLHPPSSSFPLLLLVTLPNLHGLPILYITQPLLIILGNISSLAN